MIWQLRLSRGFFDLAVDARIQLSQYVVLKNVRYDDFNVEEELELEVNIGAIGAIGVIGAIGAIGAIGVEDLNGALL